MINDLNGEKIIGTFYGKECQKNKSKRNQDRKIKYKKKASYMSNGENMIIRLMTGLIKRMLYKNESIFS